MMNENKVKGLEYRVEDKKLIVEIDLNRINSLNENDLSSSGKSYIVGTTGGNIKLDGEYSFVSLGVNCFASKDYIAGRKEIARQKALFKAEAEKDKKIESLEKQLADMRSLMENFMKQATPATPAEVKPEAKPAKASK